MGDSPAYTTRHKRLQHGINYNRNNPDDLALHHAIECYGSKDRNRHLLNAVNLYNTLNNTHTADGMENAVNLLRSNYANIVMELQDADTRRIDARLEALERNMSSVATKDDIDMLGDEISNKLNMLATQNQVCDIQQEINRLNNLIILAARQLYELSNSSKRDIFSDDVIVTSKPKELME